MVKRESPESPDTRATSWLRAYFAILKAEYRVSNAGPKRKEEIANWQDDDVSYQNALELDQARLASESLEKLLAEAPLLRQKFRDTVGERQFAVYRPAVLPADPGAHRNAARAALIADLSTIVSLLHLHYALQRDIEGLQRTITKSVIKAIVSYSAVWAASVLILRNSFHAPLVTVVLTVIYAGIVGGFVSTLRRMQKLPDDLDPFLTAERLNSFSEISLWLSPLLGAIFAVALMIVFLSGLISGPLFPEFPRIDHTLTWPFLKLMAPSTSVDLAKLCLWSFLAGFAERFVPDTLDRLVERADQAVKGPASQTAPTAASPDVSGAGQAGIIAAGAAPPTTPAAPTPEHDQKGVATDVTLTWAAIDDATYDLRIGTTNPPPPSSVDGLTQASHTPSTLDADTTYYWQVVAQNAAGMITEGPIWCFTTAAAVTPPAPPTPSATA